MNDLDDWLNSLGFDNSPAPQETAVVPVQNAPDDQQTRSEPALSTISTEDFNGILADNGFNGPAYGEAGEVNGEDDGEEGVNTGEDYLATWPEHFNPGTWAALSTEERRQAIEILQRNFGAPAPNSTVEIQLDEYDRPFIETNGERVYLGEGTTVQPEVSSASYQEALQAVQSVNDDSYPEHNPDEDAPLVMEADMLAIREEISENAMEAFNAIAEQTTSAPPAPEPLIPPNSPTLLLNDATSRFSGTEWYNEVQKQRVIVAGIGGIGSNCVYQLARMNIAALFMYDDDVVEQANMSGQLYCKEDVGKAKVDAMADMIRKYTTMRNVYAIRERFTEDSEAGDVMICGFDNMTARKTFFSSWRKHLRDKSEEEKRKCLYLDGRLSINCLQVFCITGDNEWAVSEYADRYLFTDAQAEQTQCSLKQTTYLACMIGSMIVNLFTNWTANLLNPVIPYDLPFFTEYDAQNMIFKTIK